MSIAQKLITLSNRFTHRFRKQAYEKYPADNFENKHVQHLVSLPTRQHMLHQLPKHAVIAEIGVNKGDFSAEILSTCTPLKLMLIDVWTSQRYHEGLFEGVKNRFSTGIQSGQIEIKRAFSFDAIATCPDAYFDWVYLDTDHTLETTRRELELLRLKMKPGGIIAGHDYIMGNWNGGIRYGVMEAVREFCLKYDWEMIFLTHELQDHPSFAIRPISE